MVAEAGNGAVKAESAAGELVLAGVAAVVGSAGVEVSLAGGVVGSEETSSLVVSTGVATGDGEA